MKRRYLIRGCGVMVAVLALCTLPAPAQAGSLDFESSMTATCLTADCSQVTFTLNLESEVYVDIVRIFSLDASKWSFDNLVGVTDRWGNDLNWTSRLFQDELVLKAGGQYGAEPIYVTVNMATRSSEADLWPGTLGYTGQGDTNPGSFESGETVSFGGTVTPEPISMVLLGTGMLGIVGARRRKRSEFGEDEEI